MSAVDRSSYPVRKIRLRDEGGDEDVRAMVPSERVAMVWQLTLQTWAFKEGQAPEPRLRRDVVGTLRGRR
jgi:hypothetical protein